MDKQLLNQVTQQLKQASNDSKTSAGDAPEAAPEQKEAINQIFELFRFNYHNQFLKAFPDHNTLLMAKRVWARLLIDYSSSVIMRAAEAIVKESSWLPNLHDVIEQCDATNATGVAHAHSAYIEACRAPSPKIDYAWSHPIVYFAGCASGWHYLANTAEQYAFPVFERNYDILVKRLQAGEQIELNIPPALPKTIDTPLSREEQLAEVAKLQALLTHRG